MVLGRRARGNSGLGEFDSRLCPNKFSFPPLRESASKGLICLAVFAAKTADIGKNRKIPGSTGITGNFAPSGGAGRGAASSRRIGRLLTSTLPARRDRPQSIEIPRTDRGRGVAS